MRRTVVKTIRDRIPLISALVALLGVGCASLDSPSEESAGANATADRQAQTRISAIAAKPEIKAAFRSIEEMRELNIERLITLTEIPAPPFNEEQRAAAFADMLKEVGLTDVHTDDEGNVIARRRGQNESHTIALVAHIDTVFPPDTDVTVRKEGDTYYAPGVGDNTRGLVVLLTLAEVLEKHDIATEADVLFIGSVGEEGLGDLRGVRHLFREGGPKIDSFIAVDGGGAGRLVVDAVGSSRYRVTFEGPGGHSYGAFGRAHPHQALAGAITKFTKSASRITKGEPKATFSVGRIGGGTSINSIPFKSWMEVDMRSVDQGKLSKLAAAFEEAVNDALADENARRTENDELTVEIKSVGQRPAGRGDRDGRLTLAAMAALREMGIEPRIAASSTDSNIPISLGVPAVTMGRGGVSKNAHAPNESWQDKDSHVAVQALLLTILGDAGQE